MTSLSGNNGDTETRARDLEAEGNAAMSNGLVIKAKRLYRQADSLRASEEATNA